MPRSTSLIEERAVALMAEETAVPFSNAVPEEHFRELAIKKLQQEAVSLVGAQAVIECLLGSVANEFRAEIRRYEEHIRRMMLRWLAWRDGGRGRAPQRSALSRSKHFRLLRWRHDAIWVNVPSSTRLARQSPVFARPPEKAEKRLAE